MEIKLIVSGKEIKAQISDEDLQRIQRKNTESRFERCGSGEKYYFADEDCVNWHIESSDDIDNELFSTGNYFKTEKQAKDHIRALKLWQAIKVFRQEREGTCNFGLSRNKTRYCIYYDITGGKLTTGSESYMLLGVTYFDKKETAQAAIDEFYGELMWYFTEFEDD